MNNKAHQSLSEALGIEETGKELQKIQPKYEVLPYSEQSNNDEEEDYKLSRKVFRNLIRQGSDAIDEVKDLAATGEYPQRSYEVLANLLRTVAETAKDLNSLHSGKKEANKRPQDRGDVIVEKAVFVGTTDELLKQIKENKDVSE